MTKPDEGQLISMCGEYLGTLTRPYSFKAKSPDGEDMTVTIAANGTSIYDMGSCSGTRTKKPATVLQIDVKGDRLPAIGIDLGSETEEKNLIEAAFAKQRKAVEVATAKVAESIAKRDYLAARKAYSAAGKLTLLPKELKDLLALRSTMPVDQQPVDTSEDFVSDDLATITGVDIDSMTKSEYVDFFVQYFSVFRNQKTDGGDTFAFRLMEPIGVSKNDQVKILKTAIETRVKAFIAHVAKDR